MLKLLPYGAFGLLAIIAGFLILAYGSSQRSLGRLEQINAQTNTDNQALIISADKMVKAFEQTQEGLKGLAAVKDETTPGPALTYAIDRLYAARKPDRD